MALCVFEHSDKALETRARVAGIESMSKMILFTDPQNTVDNLNEIIPALFFNIHAHGARYVRRHILTLVLQGVNFLVVQQWRRAHIE